jgi:hypothetical protein
MAASAGRGQSPGLQPILAALDTTMNRPTERQDASCRLLLRGRLWLGGSVRV